MSDGVPVELTYTVVPTVIRGCCGQVDTACTRGWRHPDGAVVLTRAGALCMVCAWSAPAAGSPIELLTFVKDHLTDESAPCSFVPPSEESP